MNVDPMPARRPDAPPTKASEGASLREAIYLRVWQAVLEHRLPPGTQLVEDRLAALFDTSRAQVRDVLARLAHEGVVDMVPNRGAFIASPTPEQTREVFEARRLLEPALVRRLTARRDAAAIATLRAVVAEEHEARARGDRPTIVRLSGWFHIELARLAGNRPLAGTMRELATLTVLAIFLYDAPHATACRDDEHEQLLHAIERRRADRAAELMLHHLDHIEGSLHLAPRADAPVDLAVALRVRP
jgi:DNA-binding GntR family transcriptional regulator